MPIRYIDGFDTYASDADFIGRNLCYHSPIVSVGNGRFGGNAMTINLDTDSWGYQDLDNNSYIAMGAAVKSTVDGDYVIMSTTGIWNDKAGDANCLLRHYADGSLALQRATGITVDQTATGVMAPNQWYYLELICHRDGVGSAKVYLNGTEILSGSGNFVANGSAHYMKWGGYNYGAVPTIYFDDVYCATDASTLPSPLGDVKIVTQTLTAGTAQADFTGGVYTDLNTNNGDTGHVTSSTIGHKSEYELADLPETGTPHCVAVYSASSKTTAGPIEIKHYIDSGGVEESSVAIAPSETGYGYAKSVHPLNPNGSVAWDETAVNAIKLGIEVTG